MDSVNVEYEYKGEDSVVEVIISPYTINLIDKLPARCYKPPLLALNAR